jgi:uncharacterized protein (UPF0218 family)
MYPPKEIKCATVTTVELRLILLPSKYRKETLAFAQIQAMQMIVCKHPPGTVIGELYEYIDTLMHPGRKIW